MDPARTAEIILSFAEEEYWHEAWQSLEDLGIWLTSGGYAPAGYKDVCALARRASAIGYPIDGWRKEHRAILRAVTALVGLRA